MASSYSNVDRSLQREQARQRRRAQEVEQDSAPAPLFGAPIKINRRNDSVHRHITDVLGNYEDVQSIVKHPSAIGVIQQPATPAPCHSHDPPAFPIPPPVSGQPPLNKPGHNQRLNGIHPNHLRAEQDIKHGHSRIGHSSVSQDRDRKSSRSSSQSPGRSDHSKERRRSHGRSDHETRTHHGDRSGAHRSGQNISRHSKQFASGEGQIQSSKASSSSHSSNKVTSSTPTVGHKPTSSRGHHSTGRSPVTPEKEQDRDRHDSGSSNRSNHSTGSNQDSVFHSPQGRPLVSKSLATNPSPVSQKKPPPKLNGMINGAFRKGSKEDRLKKKGLKIEMPDDEGHGKPQITVEKIIQEMSFDEPPLTALLTPKKEDGKFPFPVSKESGVKQELHAKGKNDDLQSLAKNHPMGASEGSGMMPSSGWEKDLDVSDSDSDCDGEKVTGSRRKSSADHLPKRTPRRSLPCSKMSDSSDSSSSSGSSSGSGSDSDSSSSDNEEEKKDEEEEVVQPAVRTPSPSPPANRSWQLKKFMNTVAPIPGLPTVAPSVLQEMSKDEDAVNMDNYNERLLENFIQNGLDDLEELMEESPKPLRSDALDDALAGLGISKVKVGDNGLLPMESKKSSPLVLDAMSCVRNPLEMDDTSGANVDPTINEKPKKKKVPTATLR